MYNKPEIFSECCAAISASLVWSSFNSSAICRMEPKNNQYSRAKEIMVIDLNKIIVHFKLNKYWNYLWFLTGKINNI